jgi:heme exporter protein A
LIFATEATEPMPSTAPAVETLVEARGLVREYGPVVAVDGIDLTLARGEFLTIFGPNGAGKSSLLRMLGGAMRPTRGTVAIGGALLDFADGEWRRRVGMLSHQGFLYPQLTAEENLRFYGRLFALADVEALAQRRLERVGLADRASIAVHKLSHGMRQRLALARALLHDPDLVLLDEPVTGLDPAAAGVLRGVLEELRRERRTVVMVTHNLAEGIALATRVAIQVRGRLAWEGTHAQVEAADFEHFYHSVVDGRT